MARPKYLDTRPGKRWSKKKSLTPQRSLGARMIERDIPPRYRIQDLSSGMCRWITCETSFEQEYCGGATVKGSSWCQAHHEICYAKKRDAMAAVSDQHQSNLAQKQAQRIQVGRIQSLATGRGYSVHPAEALLTERPD